MTKIEKEKYRNMPTVAVNSFIPCILIKEIEHGIDDYVIFVCNDNVHRCIIRYDTKDEVNYFLFNGRKYSFNVFLKTPKSMTV